MHCSLLQPHMRSGIGHDSELRPVTVFDKQFLYLYAIVVTQVMYFLFISHGVSYMHVSTASIHISSYLHQRQHRQYRTIRDSLFLKLFILTLKEPVNWRSNYVTAPASTSTTSRVHVNVLSFSITSLAVFCFFGVFVFQFKRCGRKANIGGGGGNGWEQ